MLEKIIGLSAKSFPRDVLLIFFVVFLESMCNLMCDLPSGGKLKVGIFGLGLLKLRCADNVVRPYPLNDHNLSGRLGAELENLI